MNFPKLFIIASAWMIVEFYGLPQAWSYEKNIVMPHGTGATTGRAKDAGA